MTYNFKHAIGAFTLAITIVNTICDVVKGAEGRTWANLLGLAAGAAMMGF